MVEISHREQEQKLYLPLKITKKNTKRALFSKKIILVCSKQAKIGLFGVKKQFSHIPNWNTFIQLHNKQQYICSQQ
jgi:hypothetical protein